MTSYAIIETGGKQLRVEPGRFYDIERLPVEQDGTVTIDKVLFVQNNGEVRIGQPLVPGASVEGRVLKHFRGRKVIVYKMRPKKKTRKKQGHRQELTRLLINQISFEGTTIGESQTEAAPVASVDTPIAVEAAPVASAALAAEVVEAEEPDIVAVAATEMDDTAEETAIEDVVESEAATEAEEAEVEEAEAVSAVAVDEPGGDAATEDPEA
jgi:large subunit ribosomal protein L21